MNNIRVVFMGTPVFAIPILETLIQNYQVIGVVTKPDKPIGRDQTIKFPPIKEIAMQNNIPVWQPETLKGNIDWIKNLNPDLIVTCAYGKILPKELLDLPKHHCINVHASLLPSLRGGAPIHRAIINGLEKTGITLMYMNEKMDAGDILAWAEINIENNDNAGTLHDKLSILGATLLKEKLPLIINEELPRIMQDEAAVTYAPVLTREDERIDFSKSRRSIYNQIRGLNPWPVAYTILSGDIVKVFKARELEVPYLDKVNGEIVNIYSDGIGVKAEGGEIIIEELQFAGKKKMLAKDYLNGLPNPRSLIGRCFE